MKFSKSLLSLVAVAAISFTGCGSSGSSSESGGATGPNVSCAEGTYKVLSGDITSNKTLDKDTIWILDGLVAVKDGATLTIEPGTTVAGLQGTAANAGYMVIDKDSTIIAEGTATNKITFTSEIAACGGTGAHGQWGGLTLIGNAGNINGNTQVEPYEADTSFVAGNTNAADSSGILKHIDLLYSGSEVAPDKEINGISFVGVGSGTTVSDINVTDSADDGIEVWGGTVNFSNIYISGAKDDGFDIDDGYSGRVTNLTVIQSGNAGIEMSGTTAATFDTVNITTTKDQAKEGGIYFKKAGIGGTFINVNITHNSDNNASNGAIHSKGIIDIDNTVFTNVTLGGTNVNKFTGDSADALRNKFESGTNNSY